MNDSFITFDSYFKQDIIPKIIEPIYTCDLIEEDTDDKELLEYRKTLLERKKRLASLREEILKEKIRIKKDEEES